MLTHPAWPRWPWWACPTNGSGRSGRRSSCDGRVTRPWTRRPSWRGVVTIWPTTRCRVTSSSSTSSPSRRAAKYSDSAFARRTHNLPGHMSHPFRDVAIVGVHNTAPGAATARQHDSTSIALEAALGALADAGIATGRGGRRGRSRGRPMLCLELGLGPCTRRPNGSGIPAIARGRRAGRRPASAAWSSSSPAARAPAADAAPRPHGRRRPTSSWPGYGLFTAAEFALMARRHMITYGTTTEQLAHGRCGGPQQRSRQPRAPCTPAAARSRPRTSWPHRWSPSRSTCSTAP